MSINMLKDQWKEYHIVLASQSPRRQELLRKLHIPFEVLPAKGEEKVQADLPMDVVKNLAKQKAEEIHNLKIEEHSVTEQPLLIIAADTIVAYQNQILGKPKDREHAYQMLRMLSGKTHQVYTSVCLIRDEHNTAGKERLEQGIAMLGTEQRMEKWKTGIIERCFYEKTDVTFAQMTDVEIWDYIDSDDPFDKAGGYGIQGDFAVYVQEVRGDYNNVVGLPVARLYQEMRNML